MVEIEVFKDIPDNWFVFEMGQSPVHMLWFCQMIEFKATGDEGKRKRVWREEYDTPVQAINECIKAINSGDTFL